MPSLVQSGKYGAINTTNTSIMGYYVIKFISEECTLQEDTTCGGKIISAGKLVFKEKYLICTQENTNWYWEQKSRQQVIIAPTWTILYPCLDVVSVKDVHDIPKIIYNRNNAKRALRKLHICLTDSDHDYILEYIEHREKIDLEINLRDDGDEK